jgi:hypothetical protein
MIGTPPSGREIPAEPEEHAQDFSRRWVDRLDKFCAVRMEELGRPKDELGADDLRKHKRWCAFDPEGRTAATSPAG